MKKRILLLFIIIHPSLHAKDFYWCDPNPSQANNIIHTIDQRATAIINRKPNPQKQLKTEGLLPGEGIRDISLTSKQDFLQAKLLAHAWKNTKDNKYFNSTLSYLSTWSDLYRPHFNPIDESSFVDIFEAYSLIRINLEPEERKKLDAWIQSFHNGYLNELRSAERRGVGTNWDSHRIELATTAAAALNDFTALQEVRPFFENQVRINILDDGSIVDFHTRDSIGYAVYSLEPLLNVGLISERTGLSWLPQGSNIRQRLNLALIWLKPYALGEKFHIEHANSQVDFNKRRINSGVFHVETWNPKQAANVYWLASYLYPDYSVVARELRANPGTVLQSCLN